VAIPILDNNYLELVLAASNNINDALSWKDNKIQDCLKAEVVTKGEQFAEEAMRAMVQAKYPHHAIAGEELGYELNNDDFLWAFDPIDGTAAMIQAAINEAQSIIAPDNDKPYFGITIALLYQNQPIIGAIYDLQNRDFWFGCKNSPTTLNERQLTILPSKNLSEAIIASTAPEVMFCTEIQRNKFNSICAKAKNVFTNRNCIGFMQLLTGEVDAVWEGDLALHDVAAIIPILQNSGVNVTDENGKPIIFNNANYHNEYRLIAANPILHSEIIANIDDDYNSSIIYENNNYYSKKF
jgi:inositol-phosphate phosphatase / L-galactose 1-phosphate phosphatase / histidinol-phosphatase